MSRTLALALALALLISARAMSQQPDREFTSPGCQLAFSVPYDWSVEPDTTQRASRCIFVLRPRDWRQRVAGDSVDLYSIALRAAPGSVWANATRAGFREKGTSWVILGRQGLESPATTITGSGWEGIRGTASVGCMDSKGTYVGLCDAPSAVVGNRSRSVVVVASPKSEEVLDQILKTLRFK